jgi:hypothetical protein
LPLESQFYREIQLHRSEKKEAIMISFDSKKTSLLLATMMLAKLASAQGLPWLDDPPPPTALIQNAQPEQTQPRQIMAPQVATTTDSFHGDHTRRDPGAHGPEEPAAYHVGNSGLRSLP